MAQFHCQKPGWVTQCMVRPCVASEKPSREDQLSPKFEWPATRPIQHARQHASVPALPVRPPSLVCTAQSHPHWSCCGQPLVTTGCGYLPTGYLPTGYFPTGYLPIGAATGGGGSLRGKSAAPAALSMVNNPTVMLNTAMNPAVLNTAKNAVVTTLMSFMLIPLVCRSPRTRDRGTPLFAPSGRAVSTAAYFDLSQSTTSRATKFLTKG